MERSVMMPRLSVIMPVYNVADVLQETLDCIRNQTLSPYEFILVDDGSTDGSSEICKQFVSQISYARVICQKNLGSAGARNTGVDAATGDYVLMLDADDLFSPVFFEKMLWEAKSTDADIVCCHSEQFDHKTGQKSPLSAICDKYLPSNYFRTDEIRGSIFLAFWGTVWDKMFKKSLIDRLNLRFPVGIYGAEDVVFAFPALMHSQDIAVLDDVLVQYRVGRGTSVIDQSVRNKNAEKYRRHLHDRSTAHHMIAQQMSSFPHLWEPERRGYLNWQLTDIFYALGVWQVGLHQLHLLPKDGQDFINRIRNFEFDWMELDRRPRAYFGEQLSVYDAIFPPPVVQISVPTPIPVPAFSLEEQQRIQLDRELLGLLVHQNQIYRKYIKYKILKCISFGQLHLRYVRNYRKWRAKLHRIRKLRKVYR